MSRPDLHRRASPARGLAVAALLAVLLPSHAAAVPAKPGLHDLKQPGGAVVRAQQWGDESSHGWETEAGYAIVFDQQRQGWAYAERGPDGALRSTGRLAGKEAAPAGTGKRLRPTAASGTPARILSREGTRSGLPGRASGGSTAWLAPLLGPPSAGVANVPVILVNFADTATTFGAPDIDALLFGSGTFSMKDYYEEVSYGQFSVSAGPSGVAGWYTAGHPHTYYGYGPSERWVGTLVREAVAGADETFDFSPYDQDGDCVVDVVNVVHQGHGEEDSGVDNDIWSHRWTLSSAFGFGESDGGPYLTNDVCLADPSRNVLVDDYVIEPELVEGGLATVGPFAHEYGHALGLPDLYDTGQDSQGLGRWSLMASGSWNRVSVPGDRPGHLDAWSKVFLGWVQPRLVDNAGVQVALGAAALAPDVYQLLPGWPLSGEYYLVENRQRVGFDAGLPGEGLLIWHVDGDAIASGWEGHLIENQECLPTYDCTRWHYGIALVQGDGRWDLERNANRGDAGDPYSAATNGAFTGTTVPASGTYSGRAYTARVTDIGASGPTMTATLFAVSRDLAIEGPASVLEGTNAGYGAFLRGADGSRDEVAPTWSLVTGEAVAGVDGAGLLTAAWVPWEEPATLVAEYFDGLVTHSARLAVTLQHLYLLDEALDAAGPFTTAGSAAWSGQAGVSHDGVDAARSGPLQDGQASWMEATALGAGSGSFWWKVSSEQLFDLLLFTVDGVEVQRVSGEVDWRQVTFTTLGDGPHVLRWTYAKDQNLGRGADAAWVDQLAFVPDACRTLALSPEAAAFEAGAHQGAVAVAAAPGCRWSAAADAPWLSLTGGASGAGPGTITFQVRPNAGAARAGAIIAAGQRLPVLQSTRAAGDHDGDLDGNGVSMADAARALRLASGLEVPTAYDLLHGDVAPLVDGVSRPDGKVDLSDVAVIMRWARGL